MPSSEVVAQLKEQMGYTENHVKCKDCMYFQPDMTTDIFGPGDMCARNPDIKFGVREYASCAKFAPKKV